MLPPPLWPLAGGGGGEGAPEEDAAARERSGPDSGKPPHIEFHPRPKTYNFCHEFCDFVHWQYARFRTADL